MSFNMGWGILVNCIRQSMLKLKTHYGFHDLFFKCQHLHNLIFSHFFFKAVLILKVHVNGMPFSKLYSPPGQRPCEFLPSHVVCLSICHTSHKLSHMNLSSETTVPN
jgi:hypothetical protein